MAELLTAAQMRAIEQAAIDSGEVTGLELMERAGRGVVEAILEWRPELATAPHRAVVLCGPGNNGGDGFVVARLLKERGWEVKVFLYGDETKLPPDAAENARRWREMGSVRSLSEAKIGNVDLAIDALFGTGLSRSVEDQLLWEWFLHFEDWTDFNEVECSEVLDGECRDPLTVSIDVPSGHDADSGNTLGAFFPEYPTGWGRRATRAMLTVTFHRPKLGHHLMHSPTSCGDLRVVDLGISDATARKALISLHDGDNRLGRYVTSLCVPGTLWRVASNWPLNKLVVPAHKFDHGHALILSGGLGKGGAARLAARGALRIGAGLVTVGCPSEALSENAARLDAIMLAVVDGEDALADELEARKIKAVCIGPGFGLGERCRGLVAALLGNKDGLDTHPTPGGERFRVVLDADALTEFRDDPETLFGMLHEECVLTPHEGEFGRLFPDLLAKLKEPATKGPAYSKVDATREAAKRAGCVVLFKGADTVIAHPDGRCAINSAHYERSAPWLATAGSGDVLAGFITGLLARGFSPMQAAETAAWLHVECALKFGPGLIAEDIPEQLPAVFRDLGL